MTFLIQRLEQYLLLMRFDKPIGTLLLLWPALWCLWIAAGGFPNSLVLSVFIAGVIFMRAAGCIINDFADRNFDGHVKRTKQRPLANGSVSTEESILLFAILGLCAFALVLLLNKFTILLSIVAILITMTYPFLKRVTHWPQMALGLAFAWSAPMAFAAQINYIPPYGWALFIATVCWTLAFDTQYAMADREDDIKIGLKSTAIFFGRYDRLIIALLQIITLGLLIYVGVLLNLNGWFYLGIIIAAVFAIYQQFLIRKREPEKCFKAFLNNNWLGCAIFLGTFLSYSIH